MNSLNFLNSLNTLNSMNSLNSLNSMNYLIKSNVLVTMTMHEALSCQTILQKSGIVDSVGPWVTI